ncbi:MAG: hypothetical protein QOK12_571 [Mycobacterium sp.]|nr:hypothetical protein [Mycobacterium sp.]
MRIVKLNHLPATTSPSDIATALREDGYVIVDKLASDDVMDRCERELNPYIEATGTGLDAIAGRQTRRTGALVARSPAARELITHPLVLGAVGEVLSHAHTYQLHLTQVISIYPGQPAQVIHRDEFAWDGFKFPSDYDVQCNTLWAMSEYTDEIGATRVVPGSHTLSDHHAFSPADTVPAEMERGSVLMYTGKLYHGGGANRTADRVRKAINITYAVGWVRQEENQYLSTPLDVAKTLDDGLLRLMGYQMGNPVIGYINDNEDPISAIHGDRRPLDWSNVDISYADKK